ncbi:MAG: hypothetical protein ACI959_000621, partial [Limisphaerales bacterium]
DGSLFTALDGSSLDLDASGYLNISDEKSPSLTSLNGAGWQSGFDVAYTCELDNSVLSVFGSIQDIGKVKWGNPGESFSADSTWNWTGFSVDDLSDLSGLTITGDTDSLLDVLGLDAQNGKYSESLPFIWSAGVSLRILPSNLKMYLGVQHRPNTSQVPLVYAAAGKRIGQSGFQLYGRVAYGGWGGFQVGGEAIYNLNDHLRLRLGATNVLTWILSDAMTGGMVHTSLSTSF